MSEIDQPKTSRGTIPRVLHLPMAIGVLVLLLMGFQSFWLDPAMMETDNTLGDLTGQRDLLVSELQQTEDDLTLINRLATQYRRLEQAGTFASPDRLAFAEILDDRLNGTGNDSALYRFLPMTEDTIDAGGVPLIRRTVPIDLTLFLSDDLDALEFARLQRLAHRGLLRINSFRLQRTGTTGWSSTGRPVHAQAEIGLTWVTLAPAPTEAP